MEIYFNLLLRFRRMNSRMVSLKDYGIKNILAIDDVFHQIGFKTEISFLDERIIEVFDTINNLNGEFIYYAQENNNQQLSDFFKMRREQKRQLRLQQKLENGLNPE